MVRRTCISYIYDLFLHNSLFSGMCVIGYGDHLIRRHKTLFRDAVLKKKGQKHRHGEKVDDRQNNWWEINKKLGQRSNTKEKNAGDQKKKVRGVVCT